MGTGLRAANEVLRFLLEVAAIAGFGWWGLRAVDGPVRFVIAAAVVVAAVALWGGLVAPRASRRLSDPARLVVELAFFALAGWAVAAAGSVALGVLLAVVAIANAVSLRFFEPVLGAIGPQ